MGVPLTWQEWHAIAESRGQTIDRLARENAQLQELVRVILSDMDAWQTVIASGDTGYGKGCLERLYDLRDQAFELGVEVDDSV